MSRRGWIKKDLQYNWHPYTQMKDCEDDPPILLDKARGIRLYDIDGNFYYDTIASWWCNVHGHNHPRITKAIHEQLNRLDHVMFAGFTHTPAIRLAEKLISYAPPGLARVFFSDNGSTAVETALKLSFQYWQNIGKRKKTKFVALDHGYHGDTIGAMSVSGVSLFNKIFSPLLFGSFKVVSPYCYRCPMGEKPATCRTRCIEPLEKLFRDRSGEIAAFILEPMVMAAGGMIVYPAEYLKKAGELARRYNVHLILDEVATAFGRTGTMFASEHAGARPDIVCLSKGITGGYLPLGATLVTEKIYRAFYGDYRERKTFYHGHTYTANPVSCRAALESLMLFEEEGVLEKAARLSKIIGHGLESFRALAAVGDVRYIGMIGAVELVKDKDTKEPFGFTDRIGYSLYKRGLEKHLIMRPLGNSIYMFLPLCVKERELAYIIDAMYAILKRVDKAG
ncbi:MAG: adenosylmethionine--8-amino-7-oxononanoate transaminase [Candidatus Omnitrophica bacterium]|nr:adenosylmethionine--8-amino-7-oxononanoate transaminase [Candidatus Omnitrophota bacterium]